MHCLTASCVVSGLMRSGLSGCTRTSAFAAGHSGATLLGQGPANWQATVEFVQSCCVERCVAHTARLPSWPQGIIALPPPCFYAVLWLPQKILALPWLSQPPLLDLGCTPAPRHQISLPQPPQLHCCPSRTCCIAQWQQLLLASSPDGVLQLSLAGGNPVQVALQGVDLT